MLDTRRRRNRHPKTPSTTPTQLTEPTLRNRCSRYRSQGRAHQAPAEGDAPLPPQGKSTSGFSWETTPSVTAPGRAQADKRAGMITPAGSDHARAKSPRLERIVRIFPAGTLEVAETQPPSQPSGTVSPSGIAAGMQGHGPDSPRDPRHHQGRSYPPNTSWARPRGKRTSRVPGVVTSISKIDVLLKHSNYERR